MHARTGVLALVCAVLSLALAAPAALAGNGHGNGPKDDAIVIGNAKVNKKKKPVFDGPLIPAATEVTASSVASPAVGTMRIWPSINFNTGGGRLSVYTLQAVGPHIEIWVDNALSYPTGLGACRNDGVRNVVTRDQAEYFQGQFDGNMYPKESVAFSVPQPKDGAGAQLETIAPSLIPPGYYNGPADKIVTLVTNIRDENYLDITFPSYVAGYFSPDMNRWTGRNVMTIDSFDWAHRTRANPANEPSATLCDNKPAQAFKYEGVFAHEYQHLLESYESPGESTFVNEGLSDYAITVTGYGFTKKSIYDIGWEGHILTFLGWRSVTTPANLIPQPLGGPENSLTAWEDQGGLETLSDYGAAWTYMLWLNQQFGPGFMTDLHRQNLNGFAGIQAVLDSHLTGKTVADTIHQWAATVALDASLDNPGVNLRGRPSKAEYQVDELNSSINWDNPQDYSTPGAPPNGSDYVRLRDAAGNYLSAAQIRSLEFKGGKTHTLLPVTWGTSLTAPDHAGNSALTSAAVDNLDRRILREVTVPAGSPTLTFDTWFNNEATWDFSFVQVSTDNGATWTSLSNADTSSVHDPDARAAIVANLPGFSGVSGGWKTESFSLAPYAGQTVLVAFRHMTDGATLGTDETATPDWFVDNVAVNGTTISDGTSLAGWRAEVAAPAVSGFTVELVGISSTGGAASILSQIPLDSNFSASLTGGQLRRLIGDEVDQVAAIVMYDDPTATFTTRYAPYTLKANGVTQPGG